MALQYYFPLDIRVQKEARALANAGHDVLILSWSDDKVRNRGSMIDGVEVIQLNEPKDMLRRIWNHLQFVLFFNFPFWKKKMLDIVKRYGIEVLHVHCLPLVKTGLAVAHKSGIPLVADLHETQVEAAKRDLSLAKVVWGMKRKLLRYSDRVLLPVWRWRKLERFCIQRSDRVVTVVDEAKNYYVKAHGVPPSKIVVVMNVEDLEVFSKAEIDKRICDSYRGNFIISYIGYFQHHRGLNTLITALPIILKTVPNAMLVLVGGRGEKDYEEGLKRLCKELKVEDRVVFTGWVDFRLVPSYVAASDVGVVPHNVSGHTNTTIPHKLFQYMAMGKPVVVTDAKPLKRIVEEAKCGIAVPSGDHTRMAEAIIKLHDDKEYAEKMGLNGRRAAERKYNFANQASKLCQVYGEFERRKHG
jgi:glycosyltransferase involved in cell wall biosynthesis